LAKFCAKFNNRPTLLDPLTIGSEGLLTDDSLNRFA